MQTEASNQTHSLPKETKTVRLHRWTLISSQETSGFSSWSRASGCRWAAAKGWGWHIWTACWGWGRIPPMTLRIKKGKTNQIMLKTLSNMNNVEHLLQTPKDNHKQSNTSQHTLLEPALTGTGMWRLEISESSFLKVWESGALGCGGLLPVCGSGSTFTLFKGWAVAGATEHFDSLAASCLTIHSGCDRFVGATAGGGRGGGDSCRRAVGKGAVEALHQVSSQD